MRLGVIRVEARRFKKLLNGLLQFALVIEHNPDAVLCPSAYRGSISSAAVKCSQGLRLPPRFHQRQAPVILHLREIRLQPQCLGEFRASLVESVLQGVANANANPYMRVGIRQALSASCPIQMETSVP